MTQEELTHMEANSCPELKQWLIESYHFRVIEYINKKVFGEERSSEALDL